MNNYESIRLFKKNRETDETIQELLSKEDSPDTEKQFSDLIITPLENKKKEISSLQNTEQITLPPKITDLMQKALALVRVILKDNSTLDSLKDTDLIRKLPLWLFKKTQ